MRRMHVIFLGPVLALTIQPIPWAVAGTSLDTLAVFQGRLTTVSYLPFDDGGYVLAASADTASEVAQSQLLYVRLARPGSAPQESLIASPDPQWPRISIDFPSCMPLVRRDPATSTVRVFFAVYQHPSSFDLKGLYEMVVTDSIGKPSLIVNPGGPPPVGYVGPVETVGFGVADGDRLAVYWQRKDGIWCTFHESTGWSRPYLLLSEERDLGGGEAVLPDLSIRGSTAWFSFKGYHMRDLGTNPPLGWANGLYWSFATFAEGGVQVQSKLFWRSSNRPVSYTYLVPDWNNQVFYIFGVTVISTETGRYNPFLNGVVCGAILDGATVVDPFFLVPPESGWIWFFRPVVDSQGRVHCVYILHDVTACPGPHALYYLYGSGSQWSDPECLLERPAEGFRVWYITGADVKVGQADTLHIVWSEVHTKAEGDYSYIIRFRRPLEVGTGVRQVTLAHTGLTCIPFPNPTNAFPSFRVACPAPGSVRLIVYDVRGRTVTTISKRVAGSQEVTLQAKPELHLAPGVYLFTAQFHPSQSPTVLRASGKFVVSR